MVRPIRLQENHRENDYLEQNESNAQSKRAITPILAAIRVGISIQVVLCVLADLEKLHQSIPSFEHR